MTYSIGTVGRSLVVDTRDGRHWTAKEHVFVKNEGGRWMAVRRGPRDTQLLCHPVSEEVDVTRLVNREDAAAAIAAAAGL